jgi:hypothetical protein
VEPQPIIKTTLGVEKGVQVTTDEAQRLRNNMNELVGRLKTAFEDTRRRITELEKGQADVIEDIGSLWRAVFGEEESQPSDEGDF